MTVPLEIAVFSADSGLLAQSCGASRIELNAPGSYPEGGITPPTRELMSMVPKLNIPVRIMIRPRGPPADGGPDFIYTEAEFQRMRAAIEDFKALDVLNPLRGDGFVFGIVKYKRGGRSADPRGDLFVDVDRCLELTELARPFGSVFHRAFDTIAATNRWEEGLDDLSRCHFKGLLTAGGDGPYFDNLERLNEMAARMATKLRIQLVAGGGLRHQNASGPASRLATHGEGNVWMHSASLTRREGYPFEELDADELLKLVTELSLTDPD